MANEFKVKNGLVVSGSAEIEQDLRVRGTLTVDEFHTSITTSSIIYESGSTRFGNSGDDIHTFTGSMNITGSISLNGQAIGTGKLDETTFNTYTSSYKVATTDFNNLTGSYNSFTTSYISDSSSFNARIGGLESFSSSLDTSFVSEVEFGNFSSSIKSYTSSLNSYTSSLENRLNVIDTTTGSLNSYTSSTNGRLTSIESATSSLYSFTSSVNNRLSTVETSTGSLNSFTSSINTTIKDKLNLDGVISGSSQVLNGSNIVSSSVQVTNYGFAITGSNLFKGTQTLSGSIIPSVDNTYDLGSADYQWRDVYISSGSLYIDGTKVISSTSQELQITTDNGQSIKILEGGTDSIILQTADGDIELKSNADGDILLDPTNGKIMLKGTVEILNGNKIQSSVGGTPVVFANDIVVSGSIDITGTIEGINLTDFSSSVNTRISNLESSGGSLNSFTASAISRLNAIETTTSSLNSYTTSNDTRLGIIESTTSSLNSYTSSNNTRVSTIESTTASLNSFTSSANTKFSGIETVTGSFASYSGTTNGRLSAIETSTSSLNTYSSSTNNRLTSIESTTASLSSANTTQDGRITSLENKTGSYATTGSNIFQGNQTITGSLFVSENLIIAGSSSIQHISSSVVNIGDNIITVNAQNPSIRFGGLAVIDSGSSPTVSGSMLFDSTNNQWIFVHQNQGTVTSSVLLMGPETYNDLGGELYITQNRLVKSTGIEHLAASNISDNGTTVTMLSNTVVNGTFSATGTTLVSGSSQINHNATTNYDANQHVDHTAVSITAGSGLSGGGTIASTRTITLDTGSVHFLDGVKKELNTEGVVSGSSQITYSGLSGIPSGIVSGSSQVLAGTTIHSGSFFNGISVVSGSAQISFGGITGVPSGLVSGSSQISYTGLSSIPSGIVSGSSQVSYPSLSGIPSGIVSGSVQIDLTATTNYSTGIKTRLNAEGVVSGSSQISFGSISSIPSGLVSGSSQITLSSTTGYGSVLNQAVLTTSSPTFAGVTSTSNMNANGILLGNDTTYGSPYKVIGFNSTADGGNRIFAATGTTDGMYFTASTGNGFNFRPNGGTANLVTINTAGNITAAGLTSTAGLSVSGAAYYTFNKPSTANYQTVALFGSTANGIFITSDSGIISRGAFFNGGWQATSTTGAYLNFNTSGGGMDLNVFSGATIGGAATFTSLFIVARDNFSFNGNAIYHAGNLTNLNQLTNGPGYITGITSSNVTTALGYTPYNATNPNGYITGISFANVSSKPTTISGYGITDAITTGNIGSQSVSNASTVANLTPVQFFNNMGNNHSTHTDFNSISNFGFRYVQGSTNGPGTGSSQFYGFSIGLGNDYAYSDYALQLAIPRYGSSDKYISFRTREATTWGSWNKISAGYADSAGTVTNGVYTTGNQTIGGTKTFSATTIVSVAGFAGIEYYNATAQWQGYIGTENNTGNLRYNSFNGTHTWYANGTQTMAVNGSGQLSLSGSNSSSAPLVNLTATGTGTFQRGVRLLNSGMNAGDHIMMAVGQADGSRNMGQFYFQYNGAGSTSNRLSLGLHSVDDVFNIWGNGNVEIGSTFNSGYKLDVAGQIRAYAGSSLIVSMSTVASNDAVVAARWTSGTGLEMRYNPNNALCYIDSTYPLSSGQVFGDIHIRQNVGGTMTSRMVFKAETGHIHPGANGTQNLGSASLRWGTVFTSDLSLSNGIGDYTIVEGEEKLYLYNNKNNKVYSFVLQEEDPATATPKKS
jgi:hypothetical protein